MPKRDFDFEDDDDDRPRKPRRPRDEDEDSDDRPRRRRNDAPQSNGLATAALVLGILGFCLGLVTAVPAVVCGFLGLSAAKQRNGAGKGMALTGLILGVASSLMWIAAAIIFFYVMNEGVKVVDRFVEDVKRGGTFTDRETAGKLKTLSINSNQYESAMGSLPNNIAMDELPNAKRNPNRWVANAPQNQKGAPAFPTFARSWRVELLPYVGEAQLYGQFKHDQAWNSAANRSLADRRVEAYADSSVVSDTRYRGFTGSNTMFEPYYKTRVSSVMDGTSNTILFVEATDTVKWAEGNDIRYEAGFPEPPTAQPLPAIGRFGSSTALVVMVDGSVRRVNKAIDPMVFRRLVGRADGMVTDTLPLAD